MSSPTSTGAAGATAFGRKPEEEGAGAPKPATAAKPPAIIMARKRRARRAIIVSPYPDRGSASAGPSAHAVCVKAGQAVQAGLIKAVRARDRLCFQLDVSTCKPARAF